jgi:hypothetical protein
MTAFYTMTPELFRQHHPEIASAAWIENDEFICYFDKLLGKGVKVPIGVPICAGCDTPIKRGVCPGCEPLVAVETLETRNGRELPRELRRTGTGGWL